MRLVRRIPAKLPSARPQPPLEKINLEAENRKPPKPARRKATAKRK